MRLSASPAVHTSQCVSRPCIPVSAARRRLARRVQATPDPKAVPESVPESGFPYTSYPENQKYSWEKQTKDYFVDSKTEAAKYATPAWLNLIEGVHWLTFIFGVAVLYVIFTNSALIAQNMGLSGGILSVLGFQAAVHGPVHVFCLLISHITQIYGSFFGIVMHEYEGWQIAEFRNPLVKESAYSFRHSNNAWLRAVVYRLLFAVQSAGLLIFSVGAFQPYAAPPWQCLFTVAAVASLWVAFVGPRLPPKEVVFNDRPVLPLPLALEWAFVGNAILNVFANVVVFYPLSAQIQGWLSACPVFTAGLTIVLVAGALFGFRLARWTTAGVVWGILASSIVAIKYYAVAPLTCLTFALACLVMNVPAFAVLMGGLVEGLVAESGFNQYWHFVTFWFMHYSQAAYVAMYLLLVGSDGVGAWVYGFAVYFGLYLAAILAAFCTRPPPPAPSST